MEAPIEERIDLAVEHDDAVLRLVRVLHATVDRIEDAAASHVERGRAVVAEERTGIGEDGALQAQLPRQTPDRELDFERTAEIGRAANGVLLTSAGYSQGWHRTVVERLVDVFGILDLVGTASSGP